MDAILSNHIHSPKTIMKKQKRNSGDYPQSPLYLFLEKASAFLSTFFQDFYEELFLNFPAG